MARYIDADALMKKLNEDLIGQTIVQRYNIDGFIEAFPTADVLERNVGKWSYHSNPAFGINAEDAYCSCCNYHIDTTMVDFDDYNFCPNCGADMRKETEDA